jgi:hypothetical protein
MDRWPARLGETEDRSSRHRALNDAWSTPAFLLSVRKSTPTGARISFAPFHLFNQIVNQIIDNLFDDMLVSGNGSRR